MITSGVGECLFMAVVLIYDQMFQLFVIAHPALFSPPLQHLFLLTVWLLKLRRPNQFLSVKHFL